MSERSTVAERRGPLVHRSVRHGAIVLVVGAVQFVLGMAIAQLGWTSSYSLLHNYISDLGAVNCGVWPSGTTHYVCSPWHLVFNISVILLGLLIILAALLIRSAFPARKSRSLGLFFLVLSGIGAVGVGLFPEDVNLTLHSISAVLAFLLGNLALIVLGFAMFRDTRWDGFRVYSMLSGLIGFIALILYLTHVWGPLGVGGMERLIVAPILLWAVVVGVHLARIPTYAPPRLVDPAGT
ncbi:MAG: DUF998 domain-containing protein [Thermoplasmata archaeon]|nr:DUF998 domain-containing protein [Thermoplasmata archaeon]